jgi:hypothetical protein
LKDVRLCTDTGASEVALYLDVQSRIVSYFSYLAFIYSPTAFI